MINNLYTIVKAILTNKCTNLSSHNTHDSSYMTKMILYQQGTLLAAIISKQLFVAAFSNRSAFRQIISSSLYFKKLSETTNVLQVC